MPRAKRLKKAAKEATGGGPTGNTKAARPKNSSVMTRDRAAIKKGSHLRDAATVRRLAMYRQKVPKPGEKKNQEPLKSARIAPDRRWFGNTRVISQDDMDKFREELQEKKNDPYSVILRQKKLPTALLSDPIKAKKMNILQVEPFEQTFGKKMQRKRPKLKSEDIEGLSGEAEKAMEGYKEDKDTNIKKELDYKDEVSEKVFEKGQSRRIWGELYKVIDCSDVVLMVLDARDPMGTRSKHVEAILKTKDRCHKHVILLLNKCDLVPTSVTRSLADIYVHRWVRYLSKEYPTLAFHASVTNSYGKGALIDLLKQFAKLHQDKQQISVGLVGFPNVGKSSVINTLRGKKVCSVAPIPGETKVWQYIKMFNRIHLIDCPGVVHASSLPGTATPAERMDLETIAVLRGIVRVENIGDATQHIKKVVALAEKRHLEATYSVTGWNDWEEFLIRLCTKSGKLLKGGEPDMNTAAKMVLHDWQRGRFPWFVSPPDSAQDGGVEGHEFQPIQNFSEIKVKPTFGGEDDVENVDEEEDEEEMEDENEEGATANENIAQDDEEEEEDVEEAKRAFMEKMAQSKVEEGTAGEALMTQEELETIVAGQDTSKGANGESAPTIKRLHMTLDEAEQLLEEVEGGKKKKDKKKEAAKKTSSKGVKKNKKAKK